MSALRDRKKPLADRNRIRDQSCRNDRIYWKQVMASAYQKRPFRARMDLLRRTQHSGSILGQRQQRSGTVSHGGSIEPRTEEIAGRMACMSRTDGGESTWLGVPQPRRLAEIKVHDRLA